MAAALYHDVSCTPFGHSVEWAIDRYTDFSHEDSAEWIKFDRDSTDVKKPVYFDPAGLHTLPIKEKHKLSTDRIFDIISGKNSFLINNTGIDLDNLDNVYRMALYLGLLADERGYPKILAENLKVIDGFDNFVLNEKFLYILEHWHALRSKIYRTFIYSKEYIAFEYLIFKAVGKFITSSTKEDLVNIWSQTDDSILSLFLKRKKESPELNSLAKRILLFDLDKVYGLVRTSYVDLLSNIGKEDFQAKIIKDIVDDFNATTSESYRFTTRSLQMHVTTDNRKTNRKIPVYLQKQNGEIHEHSIGNDERYILIGILGRDELPLASVNLAIQLLKKSLSSHTGRPFEQVSFTETEDFDSLQLGLFDAE